MLARRLLYRVGSQSPSSKRFSLKAEYRKLIQIAKPEQSKYVKNLVLTLAHASIFMYLPNIYGDISQLMNLKEGVNTTNEILHTYGYTLGKWTALFGTAGLLTYQRRY